MSRAEVVVTVLLTLALAGGIGFAVVYALGAQTQYEGVAFALGFGSLAAAMVVWERTLMPEREAVEERGSLPSGDDKVDAAASTFTDGAAAVVGRRTALARYFATVAGVVGLGALFPLRSCSPGARLVDENGKLVSASDLEIGSVVTVFPEGHTGPTFVDTMANDATMLVRVDPRLLALPSERADWAPQGLVAYSKVCTHAGCPVALYRAAAKQLFCPCHQSTFDVLTGGTCVFGPAGRALPQLPLQVASDGSLSARSGFAEPIGPSYWERG